MASSGPAGDAPGTWRGPVTLKPTMSDATSGVAGKLVSIDGGAATALTTAAVEVAKDGSHVVAFTATDAAGNQSTTTVSLRIDSVAPVVMPGDHGDTPRTVTPNGDTVGETVAVPFAVSEASTVTATIAGPDGATVRTLSTTAKTAAGVSWDGRTATGRPVPDGRYTVTLRARDTAGNIGDPVAVDVDVYAALASLTRSPAQLYPQDGDALARSSTVAFNLLSRASVTVRVLDASGTVVRTAFADRSLPAGPQHWAWNGKVAGGAYAKPGRYRIVVSATNGTQRAAQSTSVLADAFRLEASVTDAVRGHAFQLSARSTEPLSTSPVVVVREAGRRVLDGRDDQGLGRDVDGHHHPEAGRVRGDARAHRQGPGRGRRQEREHAAARAPVGDSTADRPLPEVAGGGIIAESISSPRGGLPEVPEMTMRTAPGHGSLRRWQVSRRLPASEDASRGASNVATIPRAGNLSSDARAG